MNKKSNTLSYWIDIFCPQYQPIMIKIAVSAVFLSILVYLENFMLITLTESFNYINLLPDTLINTKNILIEFVSQYQQGIELTVSMLFIYVVILMIRLVNVYVRVRAESFLNLESQVDLEKQVLNHLLYKDEDFYKSNSISSISNRMRMDIAIILARRKQFFDIATSVVIVFSTGVFFIQQDWMFAFTAIVTVGAGVVLSQYYARPIKDFNNRIFREEDMIKASFQECIESAPEVQVNNLFKKIQTRYQRTLQHRTTLKKKMIKITEKMVLSQGMTSTVSLIAMLFTVSYVLWSLGVTNETNQQEINAMIGFVAVIVRSLPEVYGRIAEILHLKIQLEMAQISIDRIKEYEESDLPLDTQSDVDNKPSEPFASLNLINVDFKYDTSGEQAGGGVFEINASLVKNKLVAIVGGSGSGKSTLLSLILGVRKPIKGDVLLNDKIITSMSRQSMAEYYSYLSQTSSLINASILENLYLYTGEKKNREIKSYAEIDKYSRKILADTGVMDICKSRSLDQRPVPLCKVDEAHILSVRTEILAILAENDIQIAAFDSDKIIYSLSIVENVLCGACDAQSFSAYFIEKVDIKKLDRLLTTEQRLKLVSIARKVINNTSSMLTNSNAPGEYNQLAKVSITPPLWKFRKDSLALADLPASKIESGRLLYTALKVALTLTPAEVGKNINDGEWNNILNTLRAPQITDFLLSQLNGFIELFEPGKINHKLTWRQNILFGNALTRNQRVAQKVDDLILQKLDDDILMDHLIDSGMSYVVGINGGRLSGGQRQRIMLSRTLLQNKPLVILDEPTSALDPSSRTDINQFLTSIKLGKLIIVITHDMELAKASDQVLVLKQGRLIADGVFNEIESAITENH